MREGPPFLDAYNLTEDQRIVAIGTAAAGGKDIAFIVEQDGEKADRYIKKLKEKYPDLEVTFRGNGPILGVETVKVTRK